jgi:hypothetical protein
MYGLVKRKGRRGAQRIQHLLLRFFAVNIPEVSGFFAFNSEAQSLPFFSKSRRDLY